MNYCYKELSHFEHIVVKYLYFNKNYMDNDYILSPSLCYNYTDSDCNLKQQIIIISYESH